jgi:hypothetical protein
MAVWPYNGCRPSPAAAGIRPSNLREAAAFEEVQAQVSELLQGRILVGHAIVNDLEVRAGQGRAGAGLGGATAATNATAADAMHSRLVQSSSLKHLVACQSRGRQAFVSCFFEQTSLYLGAGAAAEPPAQGCARHSAVPAIHEGTGKHAGEITWLCIVHADLGRETASGFHQDSIYSQIPHTAALFTS